MIESVCEIRSGAVVGHARVDEDDWFAFARYRWGLSANGYATSLLGTALAHGSDGRFVRKGPRKRAQFLHNLIACPEEGRRVDHINRDRLDCRRANLRLVTQAQNNQNLTPRRGCSSVYRGVSLHKASGRWHVRVTVGGINHFGGYFDIEAEAGAAASALRARYMPYSEEAAA